MKNRPMFAALAVLLCLMKPASGQDFTIRIRAVLLDPSKPEARFFVGKAGEPRVPLNLAEEGISEAQKVSTEDGYLNLFSSPTGEKDSPQANLAAAVKVASSSSSLIVLIFPAPRAIPPYRMLVLDDDPKSFPWGQGKAVNLTSVDFALKVGEHKLPIPGGKITTVPKVTKLDEYNRAQTDFYYKQDDQWVVAAERQMQYVGTLRRLFLIYKDPLALAPEVRTIVDEPPPDLGKPMP